MIIFTNHHHCYHHCQDHQTSPYLVSIANIRAVKSSFILNTEYVGGFGGVRLEKLICEPDSLVFVYFFNVFLYSCICVFVFVCLCILET